MFKKLLVLTSVLVLASCHNHHSRRERSSFKSRDQKVEFEFQNHVLSKDAKKALDEQITKIKSSNPEKIEITANCDKSRSGSKKYNLEIAERRAQAVKKYLVKNGISEAKIKISTEGADKGSNKDFKSINSCNVTIFAKK